MLLAEKDIPDLHFDVAETKEKSKPSERTDVMEIMDVDTKESAQNSDSREHSRNSLESVAGGASNQVNQQRSVGKTIDPELQNRTSEYRELSQKSRSSKKVTDEETSRKTVHQTFDKDAHLGNSKN